jgi:hypothetical protein
VKAAPNQEMAADWRVSPGGDGDGSGRKCAEDHGSSGVVAASPATRRVGKVRRAQTKKKGTAKWGNGTAACGF